jgi:hypothetical protein
MASLPRQGINCSMPLQDDTRKTDDGVQRCTAHGTWLEKFCIENNLLKYFIFNVKSDIVFLEKETDFTNYKRSYICLKSCSNLLP